LNKSLSDWEGENGYPPDLSRHSTAEHPAMTWRTAGELRDAWAKGFRLIQPEVIGAAKGAEANLIVALRVGLAGRPRMPYGGPYIADGEVDEIVAWIDAGCLDDPAIA